MASAHKRLGEDLPTGLTVEGFLAWSRQQSGRTELHEGVVYAMAPERIGHAARTFAVQRALYAAVQQGRVPCHVLPDGVAIHVSDTKWYEPDAVVSCGPKLPDDRLHVESPVVVVEVASPSTVRLDETAKLSGYFAVPSLQHDLIIDPGEPPLVHHQRQGDGTIRTRLVSTGPLRLDPPGLDLDLTELLN